MEILIVAYIKIGKIKCLNVISNGNICILNMLYINYIIYVDQLTNRINTKFSLDSAYMLTEF